MAIDEVIPTAQKMKLSLKNEIPARWGSTDGADQSNSNAACALLARTIHGKHERMKTSFGVLARL